MKENITNGINMGFILLISSILTLRLTDDVENTLKVFEYFIPILIGYVLIGIVIQWLSNLPPKEKNGATEGISLFYWLFMIFIILMVSANFIQAYIRYILLANILVLIVLWFIDYRLLSQVSKELNGVASYSNRTVIIDLENKPKTIEDFFDILEKHCRLNKISLEYVEKDLPSIVKMNGVLNKVELGYYYGFGGILINTLKITQL